MLCAFYRMGYHGRATVHGSRSTASAVLNEHQVNRDWSEIQLATARKASAESTTQLNGPRGGGK